MQGQRTEREFSSDLFRALSNYQQKEKDAEDKRRRERSEPESESYFFQTNHPAHVKSDVFSAPEEPNGSFKSQRGRGRGQARSGLAGEMIGSSNRRSFSSSGTGNNQFLLTETKRRQRTFEPFGARQLDGEPSPTRKGEDQRRWNGLRSTGTELFYDQPPKPVGAKQTKRSGPNQSKGEIINPTKNSELRGIVKKSKKPSLALRRDVFKPFVNKKKDLPKKQRWIGASVLEETLLNEMLEEALESVGLGEFVIEPEPENVIEPEPEKEREEGETSEAIAVQDVENSLEEIVHPIESPRNILISNLFSLGLKINPKDHLASDLRDLEISERLEKFRLFVKDFEEAASKKDRESYERIQGFVSGSVAKPFFSEKKQLLKVAFKPLIERMLETPNSPEFTILAGRNSVTREEISEARMLFERVRIEPKGQIGRQELAMENLEFLAGRIKKMEEEAGPHWYNLTNSDSGLAFQYGRLENLRASWSLRKFATFLTYGERLACRQMENNFLYDSARTKAAMANCCEKIISVYESVACENVGLDYELEKKAEILFDIECKREFINETTEEHPWLFDFLTEGSKVVYKVHDWSLLSRESIRLSARQTYDGLLGEDLKNFQYALLPRDFSPPSEISASGTMDDLALHRRCLSLEVEMVYHLVTSLETAFSFYRKNAKSIVKQAEINLEDFLKTSEKANSREPEFIGGGLDWGASSTTGTIKGSWGWLKEKVRSVSEVLKTITPTGPRPDPNGVATTREQQSSTAQPDLSDPERVFLDQTLSEMDDLDALEPFESIESGCSVLGMEENMHGIPRPYRGTLSGEYNYGLRFLLKTSPTLPEIWSTLCEWMKTTGEDWEGIKRSVVDRGGSDGAQTKLLRLLRDFRMSQEPARISKRKKILTELKRVETALAQQLDSLNLEDRDVDLRKSHLVTCLADVQSRLAFDKLSTLIVPKVESSIDALFERFSATPKESVVGLDSEGPQSPVGPRGVAAKKKSSIPNAQDKRKRSPDKRGEGEKNKRRKKMSTEFSPDRQSRIREIALEFEEKNFPTATSDAILRGTKLEVIAALKTYLDANESSLREFDEHFKNYAKDDDSGNTPETIFLMDVSEAKMRVARVLTATASEILLSRSIDKMPEHDDEYPDSEEFSHRYATILDQFEIYVGQLEDCAISRKEDRRRVFEKRVGSVERDDTENGNGNGEGENRYRKRSGETGLAAGHIDDNAENNRALLEIGEAIIDDYEDKDNGPPPATGPTAGSSPSAGFNLSDGSLDQAREILRSGKDLTPGGLGPASGPPSADRRLTVDEADVPEAGGLPEPPKTRPEAASQIITISDLEVLEILGISNKQLFLELVKNMFLDAAEKVILSILDDYVLKAEETPRKNVLERKETEEALKKVREDKMESVCFIMLHDTDEKNIDVPNKAMFHKKISDIYFRKLNRFRDKKTEPGTYDRINVPYVGGISELLERIPKPRFIDKQYELEALKDPVVIEYVYTGLLPQDQPARPVLNMLARKMDWKIGGTFSEHRETLRTAAIAEKSLLGRLQKLNSEDPSWNETEEEGGPNGTERKEFRQKGKLAETYFSFHQFGYKQTQAGLPVSDAFPEVSTGWQDSVFRYIGVSAFQESLLNASRPPEQKMAGLASRILLDSLTGAVKIAMFDGLGLGMFGLGMSGIGAPAFVGLPSLLGVGAGAAVSGAALVPTGTVALGSYLALLGVRSVLGAIRKNLANIFGYALPTSVVQADDDFGPMERFNRIWWADKALWGAEVTVSHWDSLVSISTGAKGFVGMIWGFVKQSKTGKILFALTALTGVSMALSPQLRRACDAIVDAPKFTGKWILKWASKGFYYVTTSKASIFLLMACWGVYFQSELFWGAVAAVNPKCLLGMGPLTGLGSCEGTEPLRRIFDATSKIWTVAIDIGNYTNPLNLLDANTTASFQNPIANLASPGELARNSAEASAAVGAGLKVLGRICIGIWRGLRMSETRNELLNPKTFNKILWKRVWMYSAKTQEESWAEQARKDKDKCNDYFFRDPNKYDPAEDVVNCADGEGAIFNSQDDLKKSIEDYKRKKAKIQKHIKFYSRLCKLSNYLLKQIDVPKLKMDIASKSAATSGDFPTLYKMLSISFPRGTSTAALLRGVGEQHAIVQEHNKYVLYDKVEAETARLFGNILEIPTHILDPPLVGSPVLKTLGDFDIRTPVDKLVYIFLFFQQSILTASIMSQRHDDCFEKTISRNVRSDSGVGLLTKESAQKILENVVMHKIGPSEIQRRLAKENLFYEQEHQYSAALGVFKSILFYSMLCNSLSYRDLSWLFDWVLGASVS